MEGIKKEEGEERMAGKRRLGKNERLEGGGEEGEDEGSRG